MLPLWCPTTRSSNNTQSPPTLFILALAFVTRGKSFCSEISSAFSFYARELNLVSKCRQMNKLYCEIIKKYGKKTKYFELKSPIQFYQELLKEKSNPRLKGNRKGIIVKDKEFYIPILNTFPTK